MICDNSILSKHILLQAFSNYLTNRVVYGNLESSIFQTVECGNLRMKFRIFNANSGTNRNDLQSVWKIPESTTKTPQSLRYNVNSASHKARSGFSQAGRRIRDARYGICNQALKGEWEGAVNPTSQIKFFQIPLKPVYKTSPAHCWPECLFPVMKFVAQIQFSSMKKRLVNFQPSRT